MKKSYRNVLIASLLALVCVPALLVAALPNSPGGFPMLPGPGRLAARAAERLNLTPEQIDDIKEILASHHDELVAEVSAVKDARVALFETIHAQSFDEASIRSASASVATAEAELAVTRGQIVQEVRGVLTPEQQAEAKEMLQDAKSFMEDLGTFLRSRFDAFAS